MITRLQAGDKIHQLRLENPSAPVPDGDGGFTSSWAPLSPTVVHAEMVDATEQNLERLAPGTVMSDATHIARFDYHPGVTTKTRVIFKQRTLNVIGVKNPEERNLITVAICTEVVA